MFGLTERVVPPARLAESYGPAAAFGAGSLAAALACLTALRARPEPYTGRTAESDRHARVAGPRPGEPS